MRLPLLIKLGLLLAAPAAFAQNADDYFHGGAQFYISNNLAQAKQFATNGLRLYPNDEKLKKLYELLNQQQQQQSQQNQQQQQQQQQDKSQQDQRQKQNQQQQQSGQQQKSDQQKSDEQKQAEQQKQDEQQKKDQQEQQKAAAEKKDQQDKDQQSGQEQPVPGQMTPEEAKRLLDAQKGNEQLLQLKPKDKPKDNNRPLKDW